MLIVYDNQQNIYEYQSIAPSSRPNKDTPTERFDQRTAPRAYPGPTRLPPGAPSPSPRPPPRHAGARTGAPHAGSGGCACRRRLLQLAQRCWWRWEGVGGAWLPWSQVAARRLLAPASGGRASFQASRVWVLVSGPRAPQRTCMCACACAPALLCCAASLTHVWMLAIGAVSVDAAGWLVDATRPIDAIVRQVRGSIEDE